MKQKLLKLLFVLPLFTGVLLFQAAKAQTEYGVKGGILFSDINRSGLTSNLSFERQEGLSIGAFYKKSKLLGPVGLQGEIMYQLKGAEVFIKEITTGSYGYGYDANLTVPLYYRNQEKLHYLSVPLLLTVPATKFLELYAGSELNYLVSKESNRVESGKLNRISLAASAGANFKLGESTRLDFRYTHDLTPYDNMGDNLNPAKLKNYGFSVTVQQTLFRK
jgi:hypothetical protein